MKNYNFECEFVDNGKQIIRVNGESKDGNYHTVMIDTWDDSSKVYYLDGETPADKENFEDEMFDYLSNKYPDYFR